MNKVSTCMIIQQNCFTLFNCVMIGNVAGIKITFLKTINYLE